MTRARRELVSLDTTPFYHCISRCVRRAFLCGEDKLTGQSFEHRKHWVIERLATLAHVFTIDICAYAIMSNHYHLVLRIDADKARQLSDKQVIRRWNKLYSLPALVDQYYRGAEQTPEATAIAQGIVADWRLRLMDLSWFMRSLNQYLARRANEEDQCRGRFWEGRYRSQALLDEAAVLTAMSYVDLNPIRAGMAETPEACDFTSIQQRIHTLTAKSRKKRLDGNETSPRLIPLKAKRKRPHQLCFDERDYLALVDWAGRAVRFGKRGYIASQVPPILDRLGLAPEIFLRQLGSAGATSRPTMLGHVVRMTAAAHELGKRFIKGVSLAKALYV